MAPATCNSKHHMSLISEFQSITTRHAQSIRKQRIDKRGKRAESAELAVQYNTWMIWFTKHGCKINPTITEREFWRLRQWYMSLRTSKKKETVSIDAIIKSLINSQIFTSEEDVNRVFMFKSVPLKDKNKTSITFDELLTAIQTKDMYKMNRLRAFLKVLKLKLPSVVRSVQKDESMTRNDRDDITEGDAMSIANDALPPATVVPMTNTHHEQPSRQNSPVNRMAGEDTCIKATRSVRKKLAMIKAVATKVDASLQSKQDINQNMPTTETTEDSSSSPPNESTGTIPKVVMGSSRNRRVSVPKLVPIGNNDKLDTESKLSRIRSGRNSILPNTVRLEGLQSRVAGRNIRETI